MIDAALPNLRNFKKKRHKNQLVYKKIIADMETPVSIFSKVCGDKKNSFLLESVTGGENKARYSIIGLKPDLLWESKGDRSWVADTQKRIENKDFIELKNKPLYSLKKLIAASKINLPKELPPMAAGLFGFVGYDIIRLKENLPNVNKEVVDSPDARLIRPTILIILDGIKNELIIASPIWKNSALDDKLNEKAYWKAIEQINNTIALVSKRIRKTKLKEIAKNYLGEPVSNFSKEKYKKIVNKAKKYIKNGDIFQVVPSQRWSMDFKLPGFSLYRSLRRINPSPYMFFFNFGDFEIIGSSPEILVKVKNKTVTIRPIAGTRPRGSNHSQDLNLQKELLKDEKELSEHLMLLDLGRNDVGRVSKINSIKITESFVVEKYSHVMHIVSNVEGELVKGVDSISALLSGLPAGTVSGAPKIRAMEIIDELETEKRGLFGGGVGYFAASGQMDFCIAIRTAILKNKVLYIQAGGGVVFDSKPEVEYQETLNKAKALIKAAEDAIHFVGK